MAILKLLSGVVDGLTIVRPALLSILFPRKIESDSKIEVRPAATAHPMLPLLKEELELVDL